MEADNTTDITPQPEVQEQSNKKRDISRINSRSEEDRKVRSEKY